MSDRSITGRPLKPQPKGKPGIRLLKRTHRWLVEEALAEAESRDDDFNATAFRGELASLGNGELPQASVDAMNDYLFDLPFAIRMGACSYLTGRKLSVPPPQFMPVREPGR